jgi:hypothetical protein
MWTSFLCWFYGHDTIRHECPCRVWSYQWERRGEKGTTTERVFVWVRYAYCLRCGVKVHNDITQKREDIQYKWLPTETITPLPGKGT